MADRNKTILLVNDNPRWLRVLREMLTSMGFTVIPAHDGMEAFRLARGYLPDVVVSDIWMDVLNGFELCKCIRATEITSKIPVILFSNLDMSKERLEQAKAAGADACLPGSPDLSALLRKIRELSP